MSTNDAGTATDTTGTAAVPPGNQPDFEQLYKQALQEATEYKSRFTGLQGTYQREQAKWKSDAAALEQLQSTNAELMTAKTTFQSSLEELQEKLDSAMTDKDVTAAALERMNIVVAEFPGLTPFLAKGLIPDDTGDDLRAKLRALTETIGEIKTHATEDYRAGASPASPPSPKAADTRGELQRRLFEAYKTGDMAVYDEVYNNLLKTGGPNG